MNNELTTTNYNSAKLAETHNAPKNNWPVDREDTKKSLSGIVTVIKDDSLNTKRAIASNIASTARVQCQNDKVLSACERELRKPNLSFEQREQLLNRMERIADVTANIHYESEDFQKAQLEYSHNLTLKILGLATFFIATELVKKVYEVKQ